MRDLEIVRKECRQALRDRRSLILLALTLAITLIASFDGCQRTFDANRQRVNAQDVDRDVWLGQGETNPHDAAHFGRYAFREVPSLAAFEPGTSDFSGSAIWMEAHFRNPESLRRAEEVVFGSPLTDLSPAWAIRVVGSLVLITFLFAAICREVQDGTLRNLLANNARVSQIIRGKSSFALGVVGVLCLACLVLSLIPAAFALNRAPDASRIAAMLVAYFIALGGFACLILALSAVCRTSRSALVASGAVWLLMTYVVPSVASHIAQSQFPTPGTREFASAIETQAQAPFWTGAARFEAVAVYEAEIMTEHRAQSFASLGFNRDALVLQAHERFANPVFDRLYGDLYETHQRQEEVLRLASALSPLYALQRISSGIAGTDLMAQRSFSDAAEKFRRELVEKMNEDMLVNAGDKSFAYRADSELWRSVADFRARSPSLRQVLQHYRFELIVLVAWYLLAYSAAYYTISRVCRSDRI